MNFIRIRNKETGGEKEVGNRDIDGSFVSIVSAGVAFVLTTLTISDMRLHVMIGVQCYFVLIFSISMMFSLLLYIC